MFQQRDKSVPGNHHRGYKDIANCGIIRTSNGHIEWSSALSFSVIYTYNLHIYVACVIIQFQKIHISIKNKICFLEKISIINFVEIN